ncbi:synaptobrevin [Flagelloscypha sp. PMI_526]|nr:synaptobrevin [Flagelloscypha sp. PMI_526]
MNSLYNAGVRQTSSLQGDLEKLRNGDNSPALLGQISASLQAMNRTIDDFDSMVKREMIKSKQEKGVLRVQKFRTDYTDLKAQFELLKAEKAQQQAASNRNELIGSSNASAIPTSPDATRRRFQNSAPQSSLHPELRPQNGDTTAESPFSRPAGFNSRESYALDEHSFINNTSQQLDDFIAQGRDVLNDLVDQRTMLKGTKRRLLDAANTLGLSRDVIGWVERRSTQDTYIFFGGAIFTFFCFYLILKYLG